MKKKRNFFVFLACELLLSDHNCLATASFLGPRKTRIVDSCDGYLWVGSRLLHGYMYFCSRYYVSVFQEVAIAGCDAFLFQFRRSAYVSRTVGLTIVDSQLLRYILQGTTTIITTYYCYYLLLLLHSNSITIYYHLSLLYFTFLSSSYHHYAASKLS